MCTAFLLGLQLIDGVISGNSAESPDILASINRNQLALFLLANVMTGLVNMSLNTLETPNVHSFSILVAYVFAVVLSAHYLNAFNITIKL